MKVLELIILGHGNNKVELLTIDSVSMELRFQDLDGMADAMIALNYFFLCRGRSHSFISKSQMGTRLDSNRMMY